MTSPQELADLLARCALGERQAFESLYRKSSAPLLGLIQRIIPDPDLASEVLQESYIKIWTHAGEYNRDKATPLVWMKTIARNQAIDLRRRSSKRWQISVDREILHEIVDKEDETVTDAFQNQRAQDMHDRLNCLSESQRQAILLIYHQGLTHEELARYLNKPLGTVKSWVRRGLLQLRSHFDQSGGGVEDAGLKAARFKHTASQKKKSAYEYLRVSRGK
jgi:RNA polymerase sigma-70 factor (ECF subfamily)